MAETFGEAVRRLRAERENMSLRELARRAHINPGYLSRIENAQRPPSAEIAGALDDALAAGGTLRAAAAAPQMAAGYQLGGDHWTREDSEALSQTLAATPPTAENALRLAHQWLVSDPPQVYQTRAGRRVGEDLVTEVEQRVHQLRELDDHIGGHDTHRLVARELEATLTLIREGSHNENVGRRLLTAAGELCQLAGWVSADAGRHAEAARFYLTGVRASHAGGDTAGAANNLSCYAYQVTNLGDAPGGVTLARTAARGADGASATVRALMWERVAWAHARAHEPGPTERALGMVEDAYVARDPGSDPAWVYWLDVDEIQVMAGRCWTELERPVRAVAILEEVTSRYRDDRARELALYLTWLVVAYVQAKEIEQAARVATRALELARQVNSARSADRVEHVRRLLVPFRGIPAVDDFEERIGAVT